MSPHLPPSLLQMLRPTSPDCTDKSTSDRHFVTWTDQEDEILRQAVATYGVDKWSVIAAQFYNKTSRQCRRRWHTYLVTDCKKGGWSPEEDQLLLEAHRRYGNRWTEIAKMVPGRTDNAVKNRFSALGKKQAKKTNLHYGAEDVKIVSRRRVLEQNSDLCNKRTRGDYTQPLPCNYNLQQQKLHHSQLKETLPKWTADQTMADRAHPVHSERTVVSALGKTVQTIPIKKTLKCATFLPVNKSTTNEGIGTDMSQVPTTYAENVSPPRLAALSHNAALLDSLVERRDARLKLWGSIDDSWKAFDWFTMEDSGRILQPANYTCKNVRLGDMRSSLYKGKENCVSYAPIPHESQIFLAPSPIIQEPINQHKHVHELGIATPTSQHERAWKAKSNLDGCSSPSEEMSYQAEDSTTLQTDCFSSYPVDQPICTTNSMVEPVGTCNAQCQDDARQDDESAALMVAAVDPSSIELTWDCQLFTDGMPSPQFSDSEKQFLLSALDSNYLPSMLESHVLCSNIGVPSYCAS